MSTKSPPPETFMFADDGSVPNTARLPVVLYRQVIAVIGATDPEPVIEKTVRANGWGDTWRNGIFPYVHYHSMIHEGMGIARGRAKVRFGGNKGKEVDLAQGDVCILAAGTGHQCLWASPDLMVIGTYPKTGKYDLCRGSKGEHARRCKPFRPFRCGSDPVYGKQVLCCSSGTTSKRRPMSSSGWIDFWDTSTRSTSTPATGRASGASPTTCCHAPPGGVMLDYGCGEALEAARVAEPLSRLILCGPAPNVRETLGARFAGSHKIDVRKPEDVPTMTAGSLDVVVMHSVAQYLSARELDALIGLFRRLLKPGGLLVLGDVIPRKLSTLSDVWALMLFGRQEGFFWAALRGLIRTFFSDYWRLRQSLGIARYDGAEIAAKLESAGFSVELARTNIGHNSRRMTFLAHVR